MQADPSATPHAAAPAAARTPAPTGFDRGSAHTLSSGAGLGTMATAFGAPVAATGYVTGAYQPSGDPYVDRMLRLEHALKRFAPKT